MGVAAALVVVVVLLVPVASPTPTPGGAAGTGAAPDPTAAPASTGTSSPSAPSASTDPDVITPATLRPAAGAISLPTTTTATTTTTPVVAGLASFYDPPDPLSPAPAGSIIRAEPIPVPAGLPEGVTAERVLYHSASDQGDDIAESGVVVVPGSPPPHGGYPIVSWAHGTTGLAPSCAPSREGIDDIPYLAQLLGSGFVVAATDYEGLGPPGVHPYLVGQSEGQATLDAARAARDLLGSRTSNQVVVFGHSQGGQAALFAGQIAGAYAPELFVAGVVSVAPVSDVDEFVPAAVGPSPDPLAVYTVASLWSWSKTYGGFSLASLLTPQALAVASTIPDQCINSLAAEFAGMPTDRIFRPGWETGRAVLADESANQPGLSASAAPVLMVQGVDDTLIPYAVTTDLVDQRLCRAQHDTVEYDAVPDAGHSNVLDAAEPTVVQWIAGRFDGRVPPVDTCTGRAAG